MRTSYGLAALLLTTSSCGGSERHVAEIDLVSPRPAAAGGSAASSTAGAGATSGSATASAATHAAPAVTAADAATAAPSPSKAASAPAPRPQPSELQTAPLSARTTLLDGRLTARLPRAVMRAELGRTAPQGPVLESRHRFVVGQKRFVLAAVELLAVRDGDLEASVRADVARWPSRPASFEVKSLPGRGQLQVVQVNPAAPGPADGPDSLQLASALYVVSADETVQRLSLYADPSAIQDAAGVASLARRIAVTLEPGGRELRRADAGIARFTVFTRGPELSIDAQRSVTLETAGEDAEKYSILRLGPLGRQGGRIDITAAGRTDPYPRRVRRVPGRLLGASMQWRAYETESGRELRYTHDALSEGFYLDIRIQGPDRQVVDDLRRMAESLQMTSPCESPRQCGPGQRCRASYCRTVEGTTAVARSAVDLDL